MPVKFERKVNKTLVRLAMTYGTETWATAKKGGEEI